MKLKNVVLSIVLGCCSVFSLFGLTACGEVSLATVTENFNKLDTTYQSYSEVFKQGQVDGMNTDYLISYGAIVDEYVSEQKDEYAELNSIYNSILAISNDYIDNNKGYVKSLAAESLNKQSKKTLTKLNKVLVLYTKQISTFVEARRVFVNYFERTNGQLTDKENSAHLRKFKKSYGVLVSKNIQLSMSLAEVVESTEIFDLLQGTVPTKEDTKIVKEYIRAKMLPIFSEFMITELENNINWEAQAETETKARIDELLAELKTEFYDYKAHFVGSNQQEIALGSAEEMKALFDMVEDFLTEAETYYQALRAFNISSLATKYDNDLEKYKKSNRLAEVYLERMEQFVEYSVPNFTSAVLNIIY